LRLTISSNFVGRSKIRPDLLGRRLHAGGRVLWDASSGAAIPLPKRVSPPVTEVGLSGLTKLLISRENELGLRGSTRGGPSEGRAGNQRDQRESSDKCLHDMSPFTDHRPSMVHQQGAVMRLQRLDRATQCLFLSSRDSG
jgi:hypothetical protein